MYLPRNTKNDNANRRKVIKILMKLQIRKPVEQTGMGCGQGGFGGVRSNARTIRMSKFFWLIDICSPVRQGGTEKVFLACQESASEIRPWHGLEDCPLPISCRVLLTSHYTIA